MPGPERWWTVPDKGTFSWSLGTILTCKSFVTFRSACFPQDRWSWTILSGKANDWRNRQHVVLDPLSNFKMGKIQRSLRWTHGTHDNSSCGAELSYSLSSVGELIWQFSASIVIFRKWWLNKGDHSVCTVGYTMPKQEMLWKVVRKRTNENMYQCGTVGKTIHKKGDPNDPWMDWCLGTIFWTHCEDWHLSHCNSRTERPISKSSLSTSIRRRFEWATLSVKTWVPGTEKMFFFNMQE